MDITSGLSHEELKLFDDEVLGRPEGLSQGVTLEPGLDFNWGEKLDYLT